MTETRDQSKLKYGKGSKLWKYWVSGPGLARYIGKPHPWTALRDALLKEGVPANMVSGLTTNIMLATPQGKAAYKQGHKSGSSDRSADAMTETRAAKVVEVRAPGEDTKPGFTARAVNYGVADSYRTSWQQGTFTESLEQRMPPVVWGHDWKDPIGRVVAYRDTAEGLDIDVELDDLDAVPRAKQAYAQLRSGTMNEFSFAFVRQADEPDPELRGVTLITKAQVDEFSIVLNGSVPNTHTLAIRSKAATIPEARAAELISEVAAGTRTLEDALTELRDAEPAFEFRALGQSDADPLATLTEVDAALASLGTELDVEDVTAARLYFSRAWDRLSQVLELLGSTPTVDGWDTPGWYREALGTEREVRSDELPVEARAADSAADDALMAELTRLAGRKARR